MLIFRHDLIYPFRDWPAADQVTGLPGATLRQLTADDGTTVIAWAVPPRPGKPVILYFMGNAGSLASAAPKLAELAHAGFGIAALNYRGAGGAEGEPRQADIVDDGVLLADQLSAITGWQGDPVIYGTSLGAAVAAQVATRRQPAALILETPFARLCETAQHHYPLIPACLLLQDERWESAEAVTQIQAPVLVLHGDADRIIPIQHGQQLFEAANQPKKMIVYPGGRHNDLRLHGAGIDIISFLNRLGGR
ncbi:MAG: alpha/beta hydrolase [Pseudomonadota bacterium]